MTAPTVPSSQLLLKKQNEIPVGADLKVFISGIPSDLSDEFMTELLKEVGSLVVFERFVNPVSKTKTTFGFAHFATRDSAITAAKVLNNLSLNLSSYCFSAQDDIIERRVVVRLEAKNDKKVSSLYELSEVDENRVKLIREKIIESIRKIEVDFKLEVERRLEEGEILEENKKSLSDILKEEETVNDQEINLLAKVSLTTKSPVLVTMSNEAYEDLVEFRRFQAKEEIISTRRQRRQIGEIVEKERKAFQEMKRRDEDKFEKPHDFKEVSSLTKTKQGDKSALGERFSQKEVEEGEVELGEVSISFETKRTKVENVGAVSSSFFKESVEDQESNRLRLRKVTEIQYSEDELLAVKSEKEKMKDKVDKAIAKVLGEADEQFSEFVCAKLSKGISKSQMVKEVKDVLDEDTEEFVDELEQYFTGRT